ncbi:MAG: zinc ribbon domain-containing protein [Phycisphaerae bacterium]|nr:zinc ribbon domain-containing protein [Phycisphaerae bacterium]
MPTYEYECTRCGKVTEVFQSMTDPPRRKLRKQDNPQCSCNAPVQRRISGGAGLIFKGSGFYITDYRSESYKEAAKKDNGSGPAEKGDGKAEKSQTPAKDSSSGNSESKSKPAKDTPKGSKKAKGEGVAV